MVLLLGITLQLAHERFSLRGSTAIVSPRSLLDQTPWTPQRGVKQNMFYTDRHHKLSIVM